MARGEFCMSSPEKLLYVCRRGDFWGGEGRGGEGVANQLSPPFVKMIHFHIKTKKDLKKSF